MSRSADTPAAFAAPGPGGWRRLADHFPGALTPEYQLLYSETAPPAMAGMFERYGVLAAGLDVAFVNGHMYIAPIPLAGPREPRRTPPGALIWVMSRLHPAFRKRNAAARRTLAARPWRAVAAHWYATERAEWHRRNAALQAIDPAALDEPELIAHLAACRQQVVDGYRRHFDLHGDDLLPVGLLIVRGEEWGLSPAVALSALDASAPTQSSPGEVPRWQLVTGYDLDAKAWCELPHRSTPSPAAASTAVDLTLLVPSQHHAELASLVEDASIAARFRDDNGLLTAAWPMGLLRRAMLEAGRRLGCTEPELAVEMTVAELVDGLRNPSELDHASIIERRDLRWRRSAMDAPATLGPEFAIPPLTALPRPLALIGGAQLAAADHMSGIGDEAVGIGTAQYTGRALVVDDPLTAFDLFEPGDVIVTRFTSPSWNALLAHAGALVTTTGGLACHAASIARELGIPAVIGDASAFDRFVTGDVLSVDPTTGCVALARPT